jgi:hypothetical protein
LRRARAPAGAAGLTITPGIRLATFERRFNQARSYVMGKYMLGWLLGVPAIVLVILYVVFH